MLNVVRMLHTIGPISLILADLFFIFLKGQFKFQVFIYLLLDLWVDKCLCLLQKTCIFWTNKIHYTYTCTFIYYLIILLCFSVQLPNHTTSIGSYHKLSSLTLKTGGLIQLSLSRSQRITWKKHFLYFHRVCKE